MSITHTYYEQKNTESSTRSKMVGWFAEKFGVLIPESTVKSASLGKLAGGTDEKVLTFPDNNLAINFGVKSSTSSYGMYFYVGAYVEGVITSSINFSFATGGSAFYGRDSVWRIDRWVVDGKLALFKFTAVCNTYGTSSTSFTLGTLTPQNADPEYLVFAMDGHWLTVPGLVNHKILRTYASGATEYIPDGYIILLPYRLYSETIYLADPLFNERPFYYCSAIAGSVGAQYTVGTKTLLCLYGNTFLEV